METRLKISGHPVHPMLMTLPLGLFVSAVVFDLGALGGFPFLGQVGYWTIIAGLFAAVIAAGAGMVDLWDVPGGAGKRRAVAYQLVNLGMIALFVLVCMVRVETQARPPAAAAFGLELLALAAGGYGAWLGATMVRRFHLGIETDAEPEPDALGVVRRP